MRCSRCGAPTSSVCPRCDARQSRDPETRGLSFGFLPGVPLPDVAGAIKTFVNRRWGPYYHLLHGDLWEAGEQESNRVELQGFSVYAVDRSTAVGTHSVCILTNRRLLASDAAGHLMQLRLTDVRSARSIREYDPVHGFSYWVVIDRAGSAVHDVKGDICLRCDTQAQSHNLAALVQGAAQEARAARSPFS